MCAHVSKEYFSGSVLICSKYCNVRYEKNGCYDDDDDDDDGGHLVLQEENTFIFN